MMLSLQMCHFGKLRHFSLSWIKQKYTYINKIFHGAAIPKVHHNLILTHYMRLLNGLVPDLAVDALNPQTLREKSRPLALVNVVALTSCCIELVGSSARVAGARALRRTLVHSNGRYPRWKAVRKIPPAKKIQVIRIVWERFQIWISVDR